MKVMHITKYVYTGGVSWFKFIRVFRVLHIWDFGEFGILFIICWESVFPLFIHLCRWFMKRIEIMDDLTITCINHIVKITWNGMGSSRFHIVGQRIILIFWI